MRRDGRDGINGRDGEDREITHQALALPIKRSVTHRALAALPTPVMLSEAKHLSVGANVERPC